MRLTVWLFTYWPVNTEGFQGSSSLLDLWHWTSCISVHSDSSVLF